MPLSTLNDGLWDRLAGDSSLITALGGTAIYLDYVPINDSLPALILGLQSGGPDNDSPLEGLDITYLVKCISTNSRQAETIADLVYARLHEADVTLDAPWTSYRCQQVQMVSYMEQEAQEQYFHRGGLYRIRASQ